MVTLIQRFGSAVNLNVHLHMITLDGVYTLEGNRPRFHQVNAPDRHHLEKLLNRIISRVMRRLVKDGLLTLDQEQPWLDLQETDILDTLNAASTRYRVAIGPGAGGRSLTLKNPGMQGKDTKPKPFTVNRDGFSLNAAVVCQPHQRQRLPPLPEPSCFGLLACLTSTNVCEPVHESVRQKLSWLTDFYHHSMTRAHPRPAAAISILGSLPEQPC